MARQIGEPRKRRTREHVLADLSRHHVEGFILRAGFAAQPVGVDYGYDLMMLTFDPDGYVETGLVYWQLKAAEQLERRRQGYAYDIEVGDYNLWMAEPLPVILALYDADARRAFWVHVQAYFSMELARHPRPGAKTVRIYADASSAVNLRSLRRIRLLKQRDERGA